MRTRTKRSACAIALALLTALAASLAPTSARAGGGGRMSSVKWEEGSRAPVGCWTQDDGCPARTGATEGVVSAGPREVAWRITVQGDVEGEPVAWRDRLFVVEKAGGKRTLHVASTATGRVRYKQTFDTSLPLAPCVSEGRLVLRSSPKTVQAFVVGERALLPRWKVAGKGSVGPPTVLADEVYVVVDGVLRRHALSDGASSWPASGGTKVANAAALAVPTKGAALESPRASVRGASVYVASGARLVELDRATGAFRREGALDAQVNVRASRVHVGHSDVLVACGGRFGEEKPADTCRFRREALEKVDPLLLESGVASVGRAWICVAPRGLGAPSLLLLETGSAGAEGAEELASLGRRADFVDARVPPTAAHDLVVLCGRVFDAGTREVLRAETLPSKSRSIPLGDLFVVVEARNKVTAWGLAGPRRVAAPLRAATSDGATADVLPAAHAVLTDGRIVAGGFALDAATGALKGSGKPGDAGTWPADTVRTLLTDEAPRRLLLATHPGEVATDVLALDRAAAATLLLDLATEAIAAADPEVARRALSEATARGAPEADAARVAKAIAAIPSKASPDAEKAAGVTARITAALAREVDVLLEVAHGVAADAPPLYATALLREVAARAPYHAGAVAWVKAHLPAGVAPRGFPDLADWLDFFDLLATASLTVYAPGQPVPEGTPASIVESLEAARAKWRPDLVGLRSGPLLVLAPPERPGAIARCLTLGRVVCDTLDVAFASMGPRRDEDRVLTTHLFSNKSEYLRVSRDGGDEGEPGYGGLERTAGHYSPSADVTRVFFPNDGSGDSSVLDTYAHELTHHWIARRRPIPTGAADVGDRASGPGYFIVEGFADFVKDFAYDVPAGKGEPSNPRANYADIVACTPKDKLLPWAALLAMSQGEAYALSSGDDARAALRWHLGEPRRFGKINLFYAQSAAATAFFFLAEDGKYRAALLAHLYRHYAGETDLAAFLGAVGLTGEAAGERIVAWCKSVVGTDG